MTSLELTLQQGCCSAFGHGINQLYTDRVFCDLNVLISGATFKCHRLIVASVSGFFESTLTSPWRESTSGVVEIQHEDVTVESFQILLDILYKGLNEISMQEVDKVLRMSVFLCVGFLEDYCIRLMCSAIPVDKSISFWRLGLTYDLPDSVCDNALSIAAVNLGSIYDSDEFLSLPRSLLLVLLAESRAKACNCSQTDITEDPPCTCMEYVTDTILNAILVWIGSDVDSSRLADLGLLLPFVDFCQLSSQMRKWLEETYSNCKLGDIILGYIAGGKSVDPVNSSWLGHTKEPHAKCVVMVGGYSWGTQSQDPGAKCSSLAAFSVSTGTTRESSAVYNLSSMPKCLDGALFTSCTWGNDLYVCGRDRHNCCEFAVYRASVNEWEMLPPPPVPRQDHAIVALDFCIYCIGGLTTEGRPIADISVLDVRTKTWSQYGRLQISVSNPVVAALAHRVYIFGGGKLTRCDRHKATEIDDFVDVEFISDVQCVDTSTGCTYVAGRFQLDYMDLVEFAISDGGTLYVAGDDGLAQMVENSALADAHEYRLLQMEGRQDQKPFMSEETAADDMNQTDTVLGITSHLNPIVHATTGTDGCMHNVVKVQDQRAPTDQEVQDRTSTTEQEARVQMALIDDELWTKMTSTANELGTKKTSMEQESQTQTSLIQHELGAKMTSTENELGTKRTSMEQEFQTQAPTMEYELGAKMKSDEHDLLTKMAAEELQTKITSTEQDLQTKITSVGEELEPKAVSKVCKSVGVEKQTKDSTCSTVSFKLIFDHGFDMDIDGLYFGKQELVRCLQSKIQSEKMGFISLIGIDVKTGHIKPKEIMLPHNKNGFQIHTLSIPTRFLTDMTKSSQAGFRFLFSPAELSTQKTLCQVRIVEDIEWTVKVVTAESASGECTGIGVYLGASLESGNTRRLAVRTCFQCRRVVSFQNQDPSLSRWHRFVHIFTDNRCDRFHGWESAFAWKGMDDDLMLCEGQVVLEYRIKPDRPEYLEEDEDDDDDSDDSDSDFSTSNSDSEQD